LPNGLFSKQKSQFGYILEGLTLEDVWSILRPFGIPCGHLVYLFPFGYVVPRKIWQPWLCEGTFILHTGLLFTNSPYFITSLTLHSFDE
jgi:hypothetical protein